MGPGITLIESWKGYEMFSKWLDRKMSKIQTDEAEQFLQILKGANRDVVAETAAKAILTAALIHEQLGRNLYEVAIWINEEPMMARKLGAEIQLFQKQGQPERAVGFMVWLHTVRAAAHPELKFSARQIWDELERAPVDHEEFGRMRLTSARASMPLISEPGQRPFDFERL